MTEPNRNHWTGAGYSLAEWAALYPPANPPGTVTETVYGPPCREKHPCEKERST